MSELMVEVLHLQGGEACIIRNASRKAIDLKGAEIVLDFEDGSAVPISLQSDALPAGGHITLWAGEKPPTDTTGSLGVFRAPRGFLLAGRPEARVVSAKTGSESTKVSDTSPEARLPGRVEIEPLAGGKEDPVPSEIPNACPHCRQPRNVVGVCVNTGCSGG